MTLHPKQHPVIPNSFGRLVVISKGKPTTQSAPPKQAPKEPPKAWRNVSQDFAVPKRPTSRSVYEGDIRTDTVDTTQKSLKTSYLDHGWADDDDMDFDNFEFDLDVKISEERVKSCPQVTESMATRYPDKPSVGTSESGVPSPPSKAPLDALCQSESSANENPGQNIRVLKRTGSSLHSSEHPGRGTRVPLDTHNAGHAQLQSEDFAGHDDSDGYGGRTSNQHNVSRQDVRVLDRKGNVEWDRGGPVLREDFNRNATIGDQARMRPIRIMQRPHQATTTPNFEGVKEVSYTNPNYEPSGTHAHERVRRVGIVTIPANLHQPSVGMQEEYGAKPVLRERGRGIQERDAGLRMEACLQQPESMTCARQSLPATANSSHAQKRNERPRGGDAGGHLFRGAMSQVLGSRAVEPRPSHTKSFTVGSTTDVAPNSCTADVGKQSEKVDCTVGWVPTTQTSASEPQPAPMHERNHSCSIDDMAVTVESNEVAGCESSGCSKGRHRGATNRSRNKNRVRASNLEGSEGRQQNAESKTGCVNPEPASARRKSEPKSRNKSERSNYPPSRERQDPNYQRSGELECLGSLANQHIEVPEGVCSNEDSLPRRRSSKKSGRKGRKEGNVALTNYFSGKNHSRKSIDTPTNEEHNIKERRIERRSGTAATCDMSPGISGKTHTNAARPLKVNMRQPDSNGRAMDSKKRGSCDVYEHRTRVPDRQGTVPQTDEPLGDSPSAQATQAVSNRSTLRDRGPKKIPVDHGNVATGRDKRQKPSSQPGGGKIEDLLRGDMSSVRCRDKATSAMADRTQSVSYNQAESSRKSRGRSRGDRRNRSRSRRQRDAQTA